MKLYMLRKSLVLCLVLLAATACVVIGSPSSEARTKRSKKAGRRPNYTLASRSGLASWHAYGHSRLTTASRSYPCGTRLRVTNTKTKKSVVVTVRDWGPAGWTGRALDLNKAAFARIAPIGKGQVNVKYRVLSLGHCRTHRH